MLKIEYKIKLNDTSRPCIELAEDYEDKSEDKFFAIELARYFLQSVLTNSGHLKYNQETLVEIDRSIRLLGQIGDNMAEIIWKEMKDRGEIDLMINKTYHIRVDSIEERNNIGELTAFRNKLYERKEGLRVLVTEPHKSIIFELTGGITNEHWLKINES